MPPPSRPDPDPDPVSELDAGPEGPNDELADLLDELLALDTVGREAFLDSVAARDPARAHELRSLLEVLPDPEPREAAERVERGEQDPFVGEPTVGETIGGCVLDAVLGRGGVGTVYAAREIDPPRLVAVKVLRIVGARASHLRRFRLEAHALARLVHPAIARIYRSGTEPHGGLALPFIVMERIDGRGFVEWARSGVDRERVLRCMARVCDGMQQGHNRGVIHRDLKPTNLLVDPEGRPHVIDFGVARLVTNDSDTPSETIAGSLIGTPAYMAPEQFELPPSDIDARVDIHALGVILYEAIVGRRPYDIPRHLYFDAARIMRETEPPAPHLVDSSISRDLSAVIMRAMARDRDRRYDSMAELADELRAVTEGREVRARPEHGYARVVRFMRQNLAWTSAVAASFIAISVAAILAWSAYRLAERSRLRARTELAAIDAERGLVPLDGYAPLDMTSIDPPLVGGMIRRQIDDTVAVPIQSDGANIMAGAISPDGRRWAAADDGGRFYLIDVETGRLDSAETPEELRGAIYSVGFSRDGSRLFASNIIGYLLELFPGRSADDDGPVAELRANIQCLLRGIIASADGRRLFLQAADRVGTYDLASGQLEWLRVGDGISLGGAAWNGTGRAYAVLGDRRVAAFEVPESGPPVEVPDFRVDHGGARAIALSPDGTLLAIGTTSGRALICDAQTGAILRRIPARHEIWSVAFDREGTALFIGDRGGRVHHADPLTGAQIGHSSAFLPEPVWALGVAANGRLYSSIGPKGAVFDPGPGWSIAPQSLSGTPIASLLVGAHTLRAVTREGWVQDLDLSLGSWVVHEYGDLGTAQVASISPDGERVAYLSRATLNVRDLRDGTTTSIGYPETARGKNYRLEWSPDGSLLAYTGWQVVRIHAADLSLVAEAGVETHEYLRLAWYAPRRLALLSGVTGLTDCTVEGDRLSMRQTAIHSSASLIYSGGRWILPRLNGSLVVTKKGGAEVLFAGESGWESELQRHRDFARAAAVSPDGTIVATGGADGTVRLWQIETGEGLVSFTGHDGQLWALHWLPDGSGFVSLDALGSVRFHDSVLRAERLAQSQDERSTANPRPAYGQ